MNNEKDLIKSKIDIVELISEYVKLAKAGSNYKGLCPFHAEKTPSFHVHPEMGIYKCFGCGEAGDSFNWLMKMEGLTFPEALQELAKRTGVKLTQFKPDRQTQDRDRTLSALLLAKEFYHWLLTDHKIGKPALQYLKNRGIKSQTIKKFQLGWSPNDWDGLQTYLTQKKNIDIQTLIRTGLVSRSSSSNRTYDRFRGRIMFPLQNPRNQTLGFAGRIVPGISDDDKKIGKYINTPETEIYHKRELLYGLEITKSDIKKKQRVIIVEGELDVISSWQVGVKEIVAIKGSTLTEEQINILKRYSEQFILALDMDIAGDKAARKAIQLAEMAGVEVKVANLPTGKDPDDIAQKKPELWKKQINNAIDVYQFLINSATSRFDSSTAIGKRKIANELLPVFKKISNQIVQAHWIGELAKCLEVREQTLIQEMNKIIPSHATVSQRASQFHQVNKIQKTSNKDELVFGSKGSKLSRRHQLEQLLLGKLLQSHFQKLFEPEIQELFTLLWITRFLAFLKENKKKHYTSIKTLDTKQLPSELQIKVAETLLLYQALLENPDTGSRIRLQTNTLIKQLQQFHLKQQLADLRHQIAQLEQKGNLSTKTSVKANQALAKAQQQFSELTSRLAKLANKKV